MSTRAGRTDSRHDSADSQMDTAEGSASMAPNGTAAYSSLTDLRAVSAAQTSAVTGRGRGEPDLTHRYRARPASVP